MEIGISDRLKDDTHGWMPSEVVLVVPLAHGEESAEQPKISKIFRAYSLLWRNWPKPQQYGLFIKVSSFSIKTSLYYKIILVAIVHLHIIVSFAYELVQHSYKWSLKWLRLGLRFRLKESSTCIHQEPKQIISTLFVFAIFFMDGSKHLKHRSRKSYLLMVSKGVNMITSCSFITFLLELSFSACVDDILIYKMKPLGFGIYKIFLKGFFLYEGSQL